MRLLLREAEERLGIAIRAHVHQMVTENQHKLPLPLPEPLQLPGCNLRLKYVLEMGWCKPKEVPRAGAGLQGISMSLGNLPHLRSGDTILPSHLRFNSLTVRWPNA